MTQGIPGPPGTPPTATIDPDAAAKAQQATEDLAASTVKLGEAFIKLVNDVSKSDNKLLSFKDNVDKAKNQLINMGTAAGDTGVGAVRLGGQIAHVVSDFAALSDGLKDASGSFGDFSKTVASAGAGIDAAGRTIGGLLSTLGGLGKIALPAGLEKSLGSITDALGKYGMKALEATEFTNKMEQGFIQMLASSGNLGQVLDATTGRLGNDQVDTQLKNFIDRTYEIGRATGVSVDKVQAFMQSMKDVRGIKGPDFNASSVFDGDRAITSIEAATRVATVTSGGLETVQKQLQRAYDNFNQGGENAHEVLGYVANLNDMVGRLGMNFDVAQTAADAVADTFAMMGNNSTAALKVLNDFVPALRNTGLSAKQASEMVKGMADGIHGMDTASKAFMSGRAGGPGGLQGAFRIDNLMAQGKFDEVAKMGENNMRKQFGNNIVTRDQAGESQSAAAQYQRQLSFAKNGAFGSMVKNDEQAAKLFEAMRAGPISGSALKGEIAGGDGALQKNMSSGKDLQMRQLTSVNQIADDVRRLVTGAKMDVARGVREEFGTTGVAKEGGASQMAQAVMTRSMTATERSINGTNQGLDPKNAPAIHMLDAVSRLLETANIITGGNKDKGRPAAATNAPIDDPQSPLTPAAQHALKHNVSVASAQSGLAIPKPVPGSTKGLAPPIAAQVQAARALALRQNEVARPTSVIPGQAMLAPPERASGPLGGHNDNKELAITGELSTRCPDCDAKGTAKMKAVATAATQKMLREH